jgi:beta-1,4-mannosyltransferase
MKVVVTHQGGGVDHPYIVQLVNALAHLPDVQVCLAESGSFPLWRTVWQHGRPDVVHLQWQHPFFLGTRLDKMVLGTLFFFAQWLTLWLMGVRFVWTVHELVRFGTVRADWELRANRLLARIVDRVIVHCETAVPPVAAACDIGPDKLTVIPHGHFADYYPPPVNREQARASLGLPAEGRLCLFFGHIKGYKGLEKLAHAFIRLTDQNIALLIAGKPHGSATGTLELLARIAADDHRIYMQFEYIPDEELPLYFSACDLVVLPYTDSLTSGAAILAASYGRAVLMPALGCMAEFPPEAAILYDPEAADGLHQALQQGLDAPLSEMGETAQRYIRQFAWPAIAAATHQVYQLAVGEVRGAVGHLPEERAK